MKHNFEDVEALLNNLLLLAALLLAFSISIVTSYSHDDFVAADTRYMTAILAVQQAENSNWSIPSITAVFMRYSLQASACFLIALTLGTATSVSLYYSSAKEDASFFNKWLYPFRMIIFVCYGTLLFGIRLFFWQLHSVIDMMFPLYGGATPENPWGSSKMAVYDQTTLYNMATQSIISGYGFYLQTEARDAFYTIQVVMYVSLAAAFVIHISLFFINGGLVQVRKVLRGIEQGHNLLRRKPERSKASAEQKAAEMKYIQESLDSNVKFLSVLTSSDAKHAVLDSLSSAELVLEDLSSVDDSCQFAMLSNTGLSAGVCLKIMKALKAQATDTAAAVV